MPVYKGHSGIEAVTKFFGLHECEYEELFVVDSYKNGKETKPKTVAARIRKFVTQKEAA